MTDGEIALMGLSTKYIDGPVSPEPNRLPETGEGGFLMLELMVAMLVLAVVGLAITTSAYTGLRFQKQAEIGNFARNIAVSRIEELAGIPTGTLSNAQNETLTPVTALGTSVQFQRSTSVVSNADGSKTVTVTVSSTSNLLSKAATITTQFAAWELTS